MIAKKGRRLHKKSGLVFHYTMLFSSITAMTVAFLPNHYSPFLFAVGIFSLYFILAGKCALNFKHKNPDLQIDKWISRVMIISGILMILLPFVFTNTINIVLCVFGCCRFVLSAPSWCFSFVFFPHSVFLRSVSSCFMLLLDLCYLCVCVC